MWTDACHFVQYCAASATGRTGMTSTNLSESAHVDKEAQAKLSGPAGNKPPRFVLAAYFTCALVWGTTWYAIRVCIEPGGYSPYIAAALRFTIATALLALICLFCKNKIRSLAIRELAWIILAGLLSGLAFGLLYVAEKDVKGGIAAVISSTSPLMASLIAMLSRTERLKRSTILGYLTSLSGVALVFHDRLQVSQAEAAAVGFLIINSFLYASSNVVLKRHGSNVSPLAANSVFFVAVSTLLWSAAVVTGGCAVPCPLPLVPSAALLYLALFGTLLTFAAFFYLLKHVRLSTVMTLSFVTPIIALIVDALFEKHGTLTVETYCGIAVVFAGLALNLFGGRAKASQKEH